MGSTTTEIFRTLPIPNSDCVPNMALVATNVPASYKVMFNQYTVTEWPRFNEDASVILDGDKSIDISAADYNCIQATRHWWREKLAPENEYQLLEGFHSNVLIPLNHFHSGSAVWEHYPPATSSSFVTKCKNRKPDFALQRGADSGSSSSSTEDDLNREPQWIVVVEVKSPRLDLGPSLSTTSVNDLLHHEEFLTFWKAASFFQLFSYMIHTSKGIGVLTNYDQIRFFKINAERKKMYMSPLVRVEQVLSRKERTPHTFQAFLYTETCEDQLESQKVKNILDVQLDEARRKAELYETKDREAEVTQKAAKRAAGASSLTHHKRSKNTSQIGEKHGKQREDSRWSIISPVTRVMDKCEVRGTLGEGIGGIVEECDYEGVKVALKVGFPFEPILDEKDGFGAVTNEIAMYEMLWELQGKVIPRMVIGGFERFYTPEAMVIITEKVGMAIKECDNRLFVDEEELTRTDVLAIREKGLEALKRMHEHGVVHCDAAVRNIRVETKDGKVDKVWWIDLGMAGVIPFDGWIDGDVEIKMFESHVDEILKKMDSQC